MGEFMGIGGIPIFTNEFCTEEVFNFKRTKNRSRRLHKKLLKRFGQQSYRRPCAFMMGDKIIAHPDVVGIINGQKFRMDFTK